MHNINIIWQPRGVDWNAHAWTMTTSLYQSVGAADAIEWACVLCGCHTQNDWVEQQICVKFCIKLERSSTKAIRMIQKAAAMGSLWLAASSQRTCSRIMSHAEFFGTTSNHPGDSAPLHPGFGAFWLFPKLKSPLKEKRFQTVDEIQENMMGQLMQTGRTVWGPKVRGPTLKGTGTSLSYV